MNSIVSKVLALGALGALFLGCGGSSTPAPAGGGGMVGTGMTGVSKFVGTWHPTSGTITILCAGVNQTMTVTDNLTWAAGVGADIVQTSGGCALKANITGTTGSALPSQMCTEMDGTTTTIISLSAYTFSLSADGQTATENASGNAMVSDSGLSVTCSYSETAGYQKIAN